MKTYRTAIVLISFKASLPAERLRISGLESNRAIDLKGACRVEMVMHSYAGIVQALHVSAVLHKVLYYSRPRECIGNFYLKPSSSLYFLKIIFKENRKEAD